jgi:SGNH domain (fused to AT3 domains)
VISEDVAQVNAELRRLADQTQNVEYFEVTQYLCPNGVCSAFDAQGGPWYFDDNHLSMAASWRRGMRSSGSMASVAVHTGGGWPNVARRVQGRSTADQAQYGSNDDVRGLQGSVLLSGRERGPRGSGSGSSTLY